MWKAWGAFVISLIILGFFGAYEAAVVFLKMPENAGLADILKTLTTLVAGYWIGSSKSSQDKDATIAQQAAAIPKPLIPAILIAALIAALCFSDRPASAAERPRRLPAKGANCIPYPQCLGGWTPSPSPPANDPISGITQFTVDDLSKAIGIASKPPALTAEIACFGLIRDGLMALQETSDTKGDGLATLYVKLVRINTLKQAIVGSSDCLAVCGRAESLVPVGILSRIPIGVVPTMCSVIKSAS